jgi:hypothetical protein
METCILLKQLVVQRERPIIEVVSNLKCILYIKANTYNGAESKVYKTFWK